ncbi:hypothetical protein FPRO04_13668 [Fusarium proliferatum]|nr:hypothetical protein FPRO04_13668 [Fusarium proliferatum]
MRDFESLAVADECEMIVSYLKKKQVEMQSLNENEVEIVVSDNPDKDVGSHLFIAAPYLDLNDRLSWIHRTTENWRIVGYCEEWPASKYAKRVLSWLTSLQIPRYYDTKGACSTCGHGWLVCGEMRHGELIRQEACDQGASSKEATLMEGRDAMSNNDGFCENKPVVRRMIAALCAYDDQILGKVLTRMTLDHEGMDLTSENQAKQWLEQRIRSPDDYWMSRLVYVLDQLITAYDFRRSKRQVPKQDSQKIGPRRQKRQNDDLELRDWRSALEWLRGRCTFCAGRGEGSPSLLKD